jgi:hypothetical protein
VGYVASPGSIAGPRGVAASGASPLVAVSAWAKTNSGDHVVVVYRGSHGGAVWEAVRVIGGGFGGLMQAITGELTCSATNCSSLRFFHSSHNTFNTQERFVGHPTSTTEKSIMKGAQLAKALARGSPSTMFVEGSVRVFLGGPLARLGAWLRLLPPATPDAGPPTPVVAGIAPEGEVCARPYVFISHDGRGGERAMMAGAGGGWGALPHRRPAASASGNIMCVGHDSRPPPPSPSPQRGCASPSLIARAVRGGVDHRRRVPRACRFCGAPCLQSRVFGDFLLTTKRRRLEGVPTSTPGAVRMEETFGALTLQFDALATETPSGAGTAHFTHVGSKLFGVVPVPRALVSVDDVTVHIAEGSSSWSLSMCMRLLGFPFFGYHGDAFVSAKDFHLPLHRLVLFDGDCGMCSWSSRLVYMVSGGSLRKRPSIYPCIVCDCMC